MLRRALSTTAATAAIILAPTAALAYEDDPYEADVPASVAQGVPFDINLEGPNENALFGLTIASANVPNSAIEIAGSQTMEKATVNGAATFSVTLNEEAVYTITAVDENGEVVEESTVTVGDPATGAGTGSDDAAGGTTLPDTGATSTPLVVGAAALLAAGAGVLVFARRQAQV
ncbi:LPXTG cell wall anchor domain-containing protein [Georgenia sp. EYE_87]|uniref:LPXTG cell wall anchor domain-containing protein n=1 Tax=Georgenia sp. EYE_87 TaxID=2853448 RepID=UPI0020053E0A|nr:LPXTG cell wall anchor domain-containing protein [Georgenia sp. EYE_87]MCK6210819.1 LPXTG cell wall anchor domain-containing protein [Georgenia sp. EYE_87]